MNIVGNRTLKSALEDKARRFPAKAFFLFEDRQGRVYNNRIGLATRHELIWGSYYLFEALHVLTGQLDAGRI